MFGNDRNQLRQMIKTAWEKFQQQQALSPLEAQIAAVVKEHPEYHHLIHQLEKDYLPEDGDTNPFLHMGLHLGLREQISTDRPAGIRQLHQQLLVKTGDAHIAEHRMIDCLAEAMWLSQSQQRPPDEAGYLRCLQDLLK
jgi:hypothetical protein